MAAVGAPAGTTDTGFCSACFTGAYPVPLSAEAREAASLVPLRRLQTPRT
jgi:hypothetical protein